MAHLLPYQHWFWDFDGTLYNSYPAIAGFFLQALRLLGREAEPDHITRLMKDRLGTAVRHFAGEAGEDRLLQTFRDLEAEAGLQDIHPYAGAEEALRTIAARGGTHYLYTHRDRSAVDALRRDGLWPLFADAVTGEDGFPSKPAPEALLHLMNKHGLSAADCVMVGDRPIDLDSGRNAGMAGLLFDPEGYFPQTACAARFQSFPQMLTWLQTAQ